MKSSDDLERERRRVKAGRTRRGWIYISPRRFRLLASVGIWITRALWLVLLILQHFSKE